MPLDWPKGYSYLTDPPLSEDVDASLLHWFPVLKYLESQSSMPESLDSVHLLSSRHDSGHPSKASVYRLIFAGKAGSSKLYVL